MLGHFTVSDAAIVHYDTSWGRMTSNVFGKTGINSTKAKTQEVFSNVR